MQEASNLKKVIVFGSSGFIGSKTWDYFKKTGDYDMVGYSSEDCNLLNPEQTKKVLSCCDEKTSIILCSAITPKLEESEDAMSKNKKMVLNVIAGLSDKKIRNIIFLSSADVYGLPPVALPICEDTESKPVKYYGKSKLIGEQLLQSELRGKCHVTILRLPGIYGYGDRFQSVVGKFIKNTMCHENIEIFGSDVVKRDFVEVNDLCRIVHHFLLEPFEGVINVATGKSISIRDLIANISEAVGINPKVNIRPNDSFQGDLIFDNSKLKSLYPNLQLTEIKQGIEDYVNKVKQDGPKVKNGKESSCFTLDNK